MGYLFLFLALACGLVKAYCGKRTSAAAACSYYAILINTARMILCIVVGLVLVLIDQPTVSVFIDPKGILIAFLCGLATACFTVSWLLAVHTVAYMIVEVFVMAGVIVPLTFSAVLYGEAIGAVQIVGVLLLLVAVYCMCTYKKTEKVRLSLPNFLLLLFCAVSSGFSDFSQKLYIQEVEQTNALVMNLYTYVFAALILFLASFVFRAKGKKSAELLSPYAVVKPIFHYVAIMAACLFLNSYFKTLSAQYLDAVLLYPLNYGCAVSLSLLMSVFIFKEKITVKGVVGIALALLSVILINVVGTV